MPVLPLPILLMMTYLPIFSGTSLERLISLTGLAILSHVRS